MTPLLAERCARATYWALPGWQAFWQPKQTPHLIPLCHPLLLSKASVDFELHEDTLCVDAVCTVKLRGQTGVEMEALTGVSVALLTIYDMCKALSKTMEIGGIHLERKSGGKSGNYTREGENV